MEEIVAQDCVLKGKNVVEAKVLVEKGVGDPPPTEIATSSCNQVCQKMVENPLEKEKSVEAKPKEAPQKFSREQKSKENLVGVEKRAPKPRNEPYQAPRSNPQRYKAPPSEVSWAKGRNDKWRCPPERKNWGYGRNVSSTRPTEGSKPKGQVGKGGGGKGGRGKPVWYEAPSVKGNGPKTRSRPSPQGVEQNAPPQPKIEAQNRIWKGKRRQPTCICCFLRGFDPHHPWWKCEKHWEAWKMVPQQP